MTMTTAAFDPRDITRPDGSLLTYYILVSLLAGPFFIVPLVPLWLRYITLRYRFDAEGISMSWGVLFRREVVLTYRRIQDIHVSRNLLERWLGLAKVAIQTASGNAGAEATVEGVRCADALRDFLYTKMRGAKDHTLGTAVVPRSGAAADPAGSDVNAGPGGHEDEALALLREIRDALGRAAAGSSSAAAPLPAPPPGVSP